MADKERRGKEEGLNLKVLLSTLDVGRRNDTTRKSSCVLIILRCAKASVKLLRYKGREKYTLYFNLINNTIILF